MLKISSNLSSIWILAILFFAGHAVAQQTISSLSPNYGAPGTTVTITGTNFNTTTTNNIVWFGATKATVTSASATSLTVTSPAGGTYSPITVVDSSTKKSGVSQNPFIPTYNNSAYLSGVISFGANVEFTSPATPYAVACADFDGDGKTDIAVVSQATTSTLSIYRNTSTSGSMTSSSFAAKVDFSLGNTASAIAIGDLNGDGKLDIVVNNQVSNTVSVFKNISTSGSFTTGSLATKFDITTGTTPMNPSIGDVDGDGKPEIIVPNFGASTVSVFRNVSSAGALTASSFSAAVTFTTATGPRTAILTDLNSDGKPEMVVTDYTSGLLSVFYNTSSSGTISTGSFAAKVDFTTAGSPEYVVASDLDLNGKPDLIVTNNASSSVSVFYNTTSGTGAITTGSLATKVDFSTASNPKIVAVSDMDGDGRPDIAAGCHGGYGAVSVLRNTSSPGSFSTSSLAAHVDFVTDTLPYGLAVADMDGDGYPDLVVTNNRNTSFSVFRNAPLSPSPTVTSLSPASGNVGTTVTITGTNFNTTAANNRVFFGATAATVTSASTTSLTVTSPTGGTYSPITVVDSSTKQSCVSQNPFTPTYNNSAYLSDIISFGGNVEFATPVKPYAVACADFDGDGKTDIAVVSQATTSSSFAAKVDFSLGNTASAIAIGDLNGDGKLDIVVNNQVSNTVSVFKNISTSGSFTTSSLATKFDIATGTTPMNPSIGDVDGDGKPEIIVPNSGANTVNVYRNVSSGGTLTASSFSSAVSFATATGPRTAILTDLNSDGKAEMVVTDFTSGLLSVYYNTSATGSIGTGSFATKVDFTTAGSPEYVVASDLDLNGKPDLVVSNNASRSVSVFYNTTSGTGAITTGSLATKVDFSTAGNPKTLAVSDLDGDGRPDIAAGCHGGFGAVSVLRNISSPGSFSTSSLAAHVDFVTDTLPYGMAVADVDGDGYPDLVVTNNLDSSMSIFRNMPVSQSPVVTSVSPLSGNAGTTVTITGTNFNTSATNNKVFFGAIAATVTSASATSLTVTSPTNGTFERISVLDSVTGRTGYAPKPFVPTFNNSSYFSGMANLTPGIELDRDTSAAAVAVGDLDGDGKSDVVVAYSHCIKIYTNLSTPGRIDASSFTHSVRLPLSWGVYGLEIKDMDGDGKLDIVTGYPTGSSGGRVSVLRNTSTSGSMSAASFASSVEFLVGGWPYSLTIADLDGDGKPEIITPDFRGTNISILRNTSTPGTINAASFAAIANIYAGVTPAYIAVGDIDGDGKVDLAISQGTPASISVLRNTSSKGYIDSSSFAAPVNFGISNVGMVAIGDLDGDGKSDIVAGTGPGFTAYRNTATAGSITTSSFSDRTDVTCTHRSTHLVLGDVNGDGRADIVTCGDGVVATYVTVVINNNTSGSLSAGAFSVQSDFTTRSLNDNSNIILADINGDGPPDVVIGTGHSLTVLQNKPLCNPPAITSVTPSTAIPGTPITITGSGFDATASNNIVRFGTGTATVTAASASSLTVTAPLFSNTDCISVFNKTCSSTGWQQYSFQPDYDNSGFMSGSFGLGNAYTLLAGGMQGGVAIGDLDGDGKPDIVSGNYLNNKLYVNRNNTDTGLITSQSFEAAVSITVGGREIWGTAIADVDGDGKQDIVAISKSNAVLHVFRNVSTTGRIDSNSFDLPVYYLIGTTLGYQPTGVICVDFDKDGRPDFAVTDSHSNKLIIYRNISDTGLISFGMPVSFTTGTDPVGLTSGDIDGDGKPDIAVVNYTSNTISIFRNTASPGALTSSSFAAKVDFATVAKSHGLTIGDLDGDGKPDIAVASTVFPFLVSVFRNTASSGTITSSSLASRVDIAAASPSFSIGMGDLDGDGKQDLITSNVSGSTNILRNTSTSGSITSSSFTPYQALGGYGRVAVGDLDGDGRPEVVTGGVTVLNNGTIPKHPAITSFSPASANPGTAITITGTNFNTTPGKNKVFFGATAGTVTSASATSLTVTAPAGAQYGPITVTDTSLGRIAYAPYAFQPKYDTTNLIPGVINFSGKFDFPCAPNPKGVVYGDFDGDGKTDIAVISSGTSPKLSIYRNTSVSGSIDSGSFATRVDFTPRGSTGGISIADFDGDGKLDIAVDTLKRVTFFRNTSRPGTIDTNSFDGPSIVSGTEVASIAASDLDADGKTDFMQLGVSFLTYSKMQWPKGYNPDGGCVIQSLVPGFTGSSFNFAINDLNGDQKPDVVYSRSGANKISVALNTGTPGYPSFDTTIEFTTGTGPANLAIGDIDGDGKPDIVVSDASSNAISILRNTFTPGAFTTGSFATKVDFATGTNPHSLALSDLDGDGKLDIAVANTGSASVTVFRNTATSGSITSTSLTAAGNFPTNSTPNAIAVGDLDGDGYPDITVTASTGASTTFSVLHNSPLKYPPVITSVSPNVANPGTSITITGTNFNTTAANNKVFFGATQATVTSASATSLTVTAPVGATYDMVSVTDTTTGASGYEQYAYLPKYDNGIYI